MQSEVPAVESRECIYFGVARNGQRNRIILQWVIGEMLTWDEQMRKRYCLFFLHVMPHPTRIPAEISHMPVTRVEGYKVKIYKENERKKIEMELIEPLRAQCREAGIEHHWKIVEKEEVRRGLVETIVEMQISMLVIGRSKKAKTVDYLQCNPPPSCLIMVVPSELRHKGTEPAALTAYMLPAASANLQNREVSTRRRKRIPLTGLCSRKISAISDKMTMTSRSSTSVSDLPNEMKSFLRKLEKQNHGSAQSTTYYECEASPSGSQILRKVEKQNSENAQATIYYECEAGPSASQEEDSPDDDVEPEETNAQDGQDGPMDETSETDMQIDERQEIDERRESDVSLMRRLEQMEMELNTERQKREEAEQRATELLLWGKYCSKKLCEQGALLQLLKAVHDGRKGH